MIPVLRPTIDEATKRELIEVLDSGWWGKGPKTAEFERRFAEFVGARHAVGVSSGTVALDASLKAYGIRGGELITTPMTFAACASVGEWNGMDVTFADIDEDSLCLDPDSVLISPSTQAIIVVNCHGRLANIKSLRERFDGLIIEDNAHAMYTPGVCQYSNIATWSFHAVKNLATGDGGMVTTDNDTIAERLKPLIWLGISTTSFDRTTSKGYSWDYDILDGDGIKAYMNDITATIGLGQLRRLEDMNAYRRTIQARYNDGLGDLPEVRLPQHSHTVQYYTIRCQNRDGLSAHLAKQGVATSLHYKPLSEFTYWKKAVKRPLPVTSRVWKELLSLPVHGALKDEDVVFIIEQVRKFYGH